ncbi:putative diguanylate cyclase YedQ [Marinomonas aquimarina]|uniref:diguanylate cyclase n=1 Tax=Marinomonas aquimarina TaxID=295068 RepID=A0A1A8TA18_9GAMM|nr:GGDEF domain-containing protein [Marinomonas aquimarina]SBS28510.1 putative diguanylate cyclase YedQ [Marinomonas aquimarina]
MNKPSRTLSFISLTLLSVVFTLTLALLNTVRFDDSLRAIFNRDHGLYDQALSERSQSYLLNVLPLMEPLQSEPSDRDDLRARALEQLDLAYAYLNVGRYLERYACVSISLEQILLLRERVAEGGNQPFLFDELSQVLSCYSLINRNQNELKANMIERALVASRSNQFWMNVGIIVVYALAIMLWFLLELQHRRGHKSETEKKAWQNRAMTDHLTSTYNRMALHESLENLVSEWPDSQNTVGLVFYDIDHFKQFNDTFGHVAGDDALRDVTAAVNALLPGHTEHFRFGGEEFFIVNHGQSHAEVVKLAEQMLAAVQDLNIHHPKSTTGILTVSVGVYMLEQREYSVDELIKKVDQLLYVAKQHGRNRVVDEFVSHEEA